MVLSLTKNYKKILQKNRVSIQDFHSSVINDFHNDRMFAITLQVYLTNIFYVISNCIDWPANVLDQLKNANINLYNFIIGKTTFFKDGLELIANYVLHDSESYHGLQIDDLNFKANSLKHPGNDNNKEINSTRLLNYTNILINKINSYFTVNDFSEYKFNVYSITSNRNPNFLQNRSLKNNNHNNVIKFVFGTVNFNMHFNKNAYYNEKSNILELSLIVERDKSNEEISSNFDVEKIFPVYEDAVFLIFDYFSFMFSIDCNNSESYDFEYELKQDKLDVVKIKIKLGTFNTAKIKYCVYPKCYAVNDPDDWDCKNYCTPYMKYENSITIDINNFNLIKNNS